MKWSRTTEFKWYFALLPQQCFRCDDWLWLERGVRYENRYGEYKRYCKDCASYVWLDAEKGAENEEH